MSKTKAERRHLDLTASLGCVVCRNLGLGATPSEIHHLRTGVGMGQRSGHFDCIPLCVRHHRASYPTGFHANPRGWQRQHGSETELLEQTLSDLEKLTELFV